jgi:hypothetical protein
MTRTISFIIGIAVVALVAVPTAFGEGRLAGSQDQSGVQYFYANERATLVDEGLVAISKPDSHEVTSGLGYEDAAVRAARISALQGGDVVGLSGDDHVTTPVSQPSPTVTSGGSDVEWPQVGIGFGIGIVLAIVFGLSLKATRPRTLAH